MKGLTITYMQEKCNLQVMGPLRLLCLLNLSHSALILEGTIVTYKISQDSGSGSDVRGQLLEPRFKCNRSKPPLFSPSYDWNM